MDVTDAKLALPLPALLNRLGFPVPDRDRFKIKCPLHGEQNGESLSAERKNGAWLWNCFGKCNCGGDEISFLEKHKNLSRCAAINLYVEMAGGPARITPRTRTKNNSSVSTPVVFDWQSCVSALRPGSEERIACERGLSPEFVSEIHKKGLIGSYQGHVAFPVQDNGLVIGAHYKVGDGWFYHPKGAGTRPFIIGELVPGAPVHCFESQWDAFAFMDVCGVRDGIIITRGSSNGKLVSGLVPRSSTCFCWTQNDELKNEKSAAEEWEKDVCANTKAMVKRATVPAQYEDLNAWTKDGNVTVDDLLETLSNAETVKEADEPLIEFKSPLELKNFAPRPGIILIGDCHIVRGSVYVIGGAPGVGKSLASVALGIAGSNRCRMVRTTGTPTVQDDDHPDRERSISAL